MSMAYICFGGNRENLQNLCPTGVHLTRPYFASFDERFNDNLFQKKTQYYLCIIAKGNNVKRGRTDVKSFSGWSKINSITFTMLL